MATKVVARLVGKKEAVAAFKALPEVVRKIFADLVITPTVLAVAAGARQRAREDTGTMKEAITASKGGKTGWGFVRIKKLVKVFAGRNGSASTRMGARKVSARAHAHLNEFGTSKMAAQPFMFPALEAEQGPALSRARAAGPAIERAYTELARTGGGS